jgi:cellulose synthase/poly-beta-1,6-N-acetylglucosamine synthase-like glycosyltransferase
MTGIKIIFWISLFLIFYAYIGYGILLFVLVRLKKFLHRSKQVSPNLNYEPEVTLFVAAYNERDYVANKISNSLDLDYPQEKLCMMWVTDGSDDGTSELLKQNDRIVVHHLPERNGKIGAMNRGMKLVTTPIVVFSDANTMLGKESIRRIVALFQDPKVGCVSGEKRIFSKDEDTAVGSGEGLYWKYESALKKMDAELNSVVGAAGELFAIRTELYQEVESDTLLDDFIISLRIAQKGYKIQYDSEAYAMETASVDIKEELKRKIRISAGGFQSIIRLRSLLNIFKFGMLSFQYISHRVLRWTLVPVSLLIILVTGIILASHEGLWNLGLYSILIWLQMLVYLMAFLGWRLENRSIRIKVLFVPYYFFIINLSVFLGFKRFISRTQSVNWDRAKRGK